jgi:CRP/FNR family transcriptional regulator, nitrogen fixation regulation protein
MITQTAIRSNADHHRFASPRNATPALRPFVDYSEHNSLGETMQLMGAMMSYPRNTEIFGENEPADYVYKVVSGAVRTYKILSDGRRQVGGFYLPGDIFGLQFADEHVFSAEAITDTKVLVLKRSALTALAGRDAAIGNELFQLTSRELRRMQDRILLLVKSAQERVASFLLEMAERVCANNIVELPMSRQDIADYLGLTIETISRTLTGLETAAAIEVPSSRRIVLRNRSALNRLNG